jgi:hypothetical protein
MKKPHLYFLSLLSLLVPVAALANPVAIPSPGFDFSSNFLTNFYRFAIFLFLAILIELIVGFFFCLVTKTSKKILIWIVFANIISFTIFSLLLQPAMNLLGLIAILILELLVTVFEGYFIYYFSKQYITFTKSLSLSLVMNIFSFVASPILLLFYTIMTEGISTTQF